MPVHCTQCYWIVMFSYVTENVKKSPPPHLSPPPPNWTRYWRTSCPYFHGRNRESFFWFLWSFLISVEGFHHWPVEPLGKIVQLFLYWGVPREGDDRQCSENIIGKFKHFLILRTFHMRSCLVDVCNVFVVGESKGRRWKPERIKIQRLGYRFSIGCKSIPYCMIFFMEITDIWQKSWDFFLRFLKSIRRYGFSYSLLVALNVFHLCFI
jgi:hypothetical protein